jgi:hypothetical protein
MKVRAKRGKKIKQEFFFPPPSWSVSHGRGEKKKARKKKQSLFFNARCRHFKPFVC